MRAKYIQPITELNTVTTEQQVLGTSIYGYNNPSSTDNISNGNGPQTSTEGDYGDDIIWNNAKQHSTGGWDSWDD